MIGERIKKAREEAHLTQKALAVDLEVSPAAISQYETGKRKPSVEILLKIIDILNISPNYVLNRDISVATDDTNYTIRISKNELKIINELRKYPRLYKKISLNPSKIIKTLDKRFFLDN